MDRPGLRQVPRNPKSDLGRAGTNISGSDRAHADEETLQEEHRHLRKWVAKLRTENDDLKEKIRKGDLIAMEQDKQLQELLASAQGGAGLPGEALDQLREDLQALLQFRRKGHDCRQVIEDKEVKMAAIVHELQTTRIFDMEAQVAEAKLEAKKRANEWVESNTTNRTTCFSDSQREQTQARNLLKQIFEIESQVSEHQREMITLQDECDRLASGLSDREKQIAKLHEKREEIEERRDIDEKNTSPENMEKLLTARANLQFEHRELQAKVNKMKSEAGKMQKNQFERTLRRKSPNGTSVSKSFSNSSFVPGGTDTGVSDLLRRFHRACATSQRSAVEILASADSDHDGYLSSFELMSVLSKLKVLTSNVADIDALVSMLGHNGLVGILDIFFASVLQPPCVTPSDNELTAAAQALAWACRRQKITEDLVRQSILEKLVQSDSNLVQEFTSFCEKRGVRRVHASCLACGLESRGAGLAQLLPSWRCPSDKIAADVFARFLKDVLVNRETAVPLLQGQIELEDFIQKLALSLGAKWSRENLEIVALVAETSKGLSDAPPVVDGSRLARAIETGGFLLEFPQEYATCHLETRAAIEKALSRRSRSGLASKPPELQQVAQGTTDAGSIYAPAPPAIQTPTNLVQISNDLANVFKVSTPNVAGTHQTSPPPLPPNRAGIHQHSPPSLPPNGVGIHQPSPPPLPPNGAGIHQPSPPPLPPNGAGILQPAPSPLPQSASSLSQSKVAPNQALVVQSHVNDEASLAQSMATLAQTIPREEEVDDEIGSEIYEDDEFYSDGEDEN